VCWVMVLGSFEGKEICGKLGSRRRLIVGVSWGGGVDWTALLVCNCQRLDQHIVNRETIVVGFLCPKLLRLGFLTLFNTL
jgi:hypothetical protein